jgi:THO complex subunit 2
VFAGCLFRRFPSIELAGLLNYIFYQLKDGNSFDFIILKELLTRMSGLEQLIEGASEQQLEAMAGGETLKAEVSILNS